MLQYLCRSLYNVNMICLLFNRFRGTALFANRGRSTFRKLHARWRTVHIPSTLLGLFSKCLRGSLFSPVVNHLVYEDDAGERRNRLNGRGGKLSGLRVILGYLVVIDKRGTFQSHTHERDFRNILSLTRRLRFLYWTTCNMKS